MPEVQTNRVLGLLQQWERGNENALGVQVPLVYQELRSVAHHRLKSERVDHTLQSTASVNEPFRRLNGSDPVRLRDRGHFIATASRARGQVLVGDAAIATAAVESRLRIWGKCPGAKKTCPSWRCTERRTHCLMQMKSRERVGHRTENGYAVK